MQLLLSAVLSLLVVGPAVCWPMDDYVDRAYPGAYPSMEQFERPQLQNEMEDSYLSNRNPGPNMNEQANSQSNYYNPYYTARSQEEDVPLPKDAADDLRKQINAAKGGQAELQDTSSGVLRQGSTVGLFLDNGHWLGCAGETCSGAACPGRCFERNDWTSCGGEIFQIYRAAGPGAIRSGDFVGLYYHSQQWFSMFKGHGRIETCPGIPNPKTGFHEFLAWLHCGAEVFRVYAKGKQDKATITDQDTLMFYIPFGETYVSFRNDKIITSNCPRDQSGHQLPPSNRAFELCGLESVEITVRD